jgi:hypothetical protein
MYFRWDDCVPHLVKKNVQSFRTNCCRSESSQSQREKRRTLTDFFSSWATTCLFSDLSSILGCADSLRYKQTN